MPCLPVVDPTCNPIEDVIVGGVESIFNEIAEISVVTAGWAVKTLVTGWIMTPSPIMDNQDIVNNLRDYTYWYVTAVAVAALLFAASKMVLGNGRAGIDAAAGLGKLVLVTSLVVPITIALTEAGDAYSKWIITESVGAGLDQRVALFAPQAGMLGITQFAAIGIAGFLVLVSLVQMLVSIAVGGLKILLCGLAPLPAAASMTGGGKATLSRYLAWLGGALLYKPVAATLYAGAFWMVGTGESFETVMTGIVVITGAIFVMPALLRLLAPVAAQVAGPSSAAIGGTVAEGAGKVASGAVRLHTAGGGARPAPPAANGGSGSGAPPPTRAPAAIGPGPAAAGDSGPGPRTGPSGPNGDTGGRGPAGTPPPAGTGAGARGGAGATAGTVGTAAGGGAAAAGGGAAGAAGGAAAAAGPAGAAVVAGVTAAKAGASVVRKVGGIAGGAAETGDQQ
ncbi:hypothetical protein [Actinoplanes subglobosus]|uniref:TrbL/VirB6 plasmid conjugal transfer protein n=1 Tax=Actinoplanes subglobosus TaxID=1547892 RepID=A0ABV8IRW4_9ACTN